MRVSEYYELGRKQPTLDFVDVDIENDVPVYIDPSAIQNLSDDWSKQCLAMLSTFFDSVLDALKANDRSRARDLLIRLQEPNETHFGLSRARSQGRGLGPYLVRKMCDNLAASSAARTGLLEDLEDTALFIEGIGKDIISDVTTNVIRGMLLSYTHSMASMYDIPLEEGVYSGSAWDPIRREWDESHTRMPVPGGRPLLLVPKVLVRHDLHLTKDDYFRNHLAPCLQSEELEKPGSKLIKIAKDGKRWVSKADILITYNGDKSHMVKLSSQRSEIFHAYKESKRQNPSLPLTHEQLRRATHTERVDFDALLKAVLDISPGPDGASQYHRNIEALFTALFYPALTQPIVEHEIDQGRKRVDIMYTNTATEGFFAWLTRQRHPSSYVFVECKNYKSEIGNPELDQICGRFTPLRGKVGIIACRSLGDKDRFMQRCRDVAQSRHEFVLMLDDDDLVLLVDEVKRALSAAEQTTPGNLLPDEPEPSEFRLLFERFRVLVS